MSTVKSHENSLSPPFWLVRRNGEKKLMGNCRICQLRAPFKLDTIGTTFNGITIFDLLLR